MSKWWQFRKPAEDRSWCVVQDLRPFGFRVEEDNLTEREAIRRSAYSRYLRPAQREAVASYNLRVVEDSEFFNRELHAQSRRDIAGAGPGDRLAEYNRADEAVDSELLKQIAPWRGFKGQQTSHNK